MSADGHRAELLAPTPQRAYAFVAPRCDDDAIARPQMSPWLALDALVRPMSAPAPLAAQSPLDRTCVPPERPASPFRCTNPMVRDIRFRRGMSAAALDAPRSVAPRPPMRDA